jgi:hypothetical protein
MTYSNVTDYNKYLIESKTQIDIIEYVKTVNKIIYNIDIDFIDEFIELVSKDECCIHHSLLQKYGILTLNEGTHHIRRLLNQYEFIENIDFKLANFGEFNKGGRGNKIEYYLHPRAFKLCLMRSLKKKKYANYYLLLEECVTYYKNYQDKLKEKYIIRLELKNNINKIIIQNQNDNISKLQTDVKLLLTKNDEILSENKVILSENKDMKKILEANQIRLDKTFDKLVGTHEEIRDIKDKLDNATDDRVIKPKDKSTFEYLIILKTNDPDELYKYYCIRCQKRAIPQRLAEKENYYEIKRIGYTPNSINLYNRIKEKLGNNLDRRNNRFNLKDISEQRFLRRIDKINEEKLFNRFFYLQTKY